MLMTALTICSFRGVLEFNSDNVISFVILFKVNCISAVDLFIL